MTKSLTETFQDNEVMVLHNKHDILSLFEILNYLDVRGCHFLSCLSSSLSYPVTVVIEYSYVDRVFRDSYYYYFSNKHFDIPRTCIRVSFFLGAYDESFFRTTESQKQLQENAVGFVVLRPLSPGCIGRTIIDPFKLNNFSGYVRTTSFSFELLGAEFSIQAFPFMSQDTETMTCAETTVWNVLEYYGTRYPDYRITVPSEILSILSENSYERVVPSRGMIYEQITQVLKKLGFFPRCYFDINDDTKKLLHYYVESGIPVIVIVQEKYDKKQRHAIVCIGHDSNPSYTIKTIPINDLSYIDSADLFNNYILIDDNTFPYENKKYTEFTLFKEPKVLGFIVPLYKRIFLEARDANSIAVEFLFRSKFRIDISKLNFNEHKYSETENPIVFRLFLTSSRHYKKFRNISSPSKFMAKVYSDLPLPKFIWVAEISLKSLYIENKIFGELIIDATSSALSGLRSLVFRRYSKYFSFRRPNDPLTNIFSMVSLEGDLTDIYPLYVNNLMGR